MTAPLPDFDKLWNYGDPTATEAKFREFLLAAEQSSDRDYHAQLLTQIARCQGRQRRFGEAHATLDRAEALLTNDTNLARVRYLLERGRAFNTSGQRERSLPLFGKAADLATANNLMRYAIDAVHMLGIAEPSPAEQLKWNLRGIELVEKHPEQDGWRWALYNNTGETYLLLHDYANALLMFEKLIEWRKSHGHEPDIFMKKDVAKCLRLLNRPAAALAIIEPIERELRAKGESNGWISEELAETLLLLDRAADARPHFTMAYEHFSGDPSCGRPTAELERLKRLGSTP